MIHLESWGEVIDMDPPFVDCQAVGKCGVESGRKGPPAWIKSRLPKHGGFEARGQVFVVPADFSRQLT